MSRSVDERVVEMRFDNQRFERNVQTTMSTLDKLKQSLKLDGAAKGLEDIDKAAKSVKMSGITNAVETVKNRFSALEVVAITTLANLTNSVVNAGKRIVDSFTLEPIKQGFEEYELKMGAVQTIMASTGADIKTVNGYLDELNTYADKTIYSFSDMTQSIGKFTNAGVSLDDAVKAIQGISNEAAVSGANTNEASRAMYNFAQALSAGAVKLIDWKSIENANMATVEFKQSLLDTALAMGTVVKVGDQYQTTTTDANGKVSDLFTATSMFNDSLSAQWMTTDVLIQTLGNYATDVREMTAEEKKAYEEKLRGIGYTEEQIKAIEELGQKAFDSAQDVKTFTQLMDTLKEAAGSGWAQTFEILFGDLEEAKSLWTGVSKVVGGFIDRTSQARNEMLSGWKELGGRKDAIDAATNAFEGLASVVKPFAQAFREIFPATTSEQLVNLTKGLKEFTSHLKLSDKDSQNLKNTFKGLFAVLDLAKQGVVAFVKAVFPMTKGLGSLGSGVLGVTGKVGEWLASLDQAAKKSDVFNKAVQKLHNTAGPFFTSIGNHIHGAVTAIKEFAKAHFDIPDTSGLMSASDKLKARIEPFKKIGEVAKAAMGKLVDAFKASAPMLARLGGIITDAIGKVFDGISKALHGEGFDSLIDLLNGGMMVGIGAGIMKFIKNLTGLESTVDDTLGGFSGIVEGVKSVIDGAKETLVDFQASLKADILMKIAGAVGILAASLLVLSMIDSDKLGGSLASISILFGELAASMALFDKTLSGKKGLMTTGATMIEMSAAILILASALKKIAGIDSNKLAGSLVGITVLIGEMVAASLALSKWGGKVQTSAVGMILFAEAINILAKAVGKLAELDTEKLTRGLVGVGVLLGELSAFMVAAKFGKFKATQGLAIIELSAALLILEKAVSGFGNMDIEVIKKGLSGVGIILAEVAAFSVIAGKAKHILSSAASLAVIGAAMLIFAKALKDIGMMPAESIGKGMAGIGSSLAAVAIAVNLMPKNMVGIGLGLIEVAAALKIIGSVIRDAGGMKWEDIGKGMVVLAGSMTILAVALHAMKGTLGGASAMLVMSAALAVFTPMLKSLGSMSLAEIGKSLLALAGAFTVMGIAGAVLGPIVPAILGLSGALALLGVAVAACGAGVLAFSAGLASLAVSGVAGATALVAVLEILIVGVLGVIADSAKAIAGAVKAIVLALVDVIVECAPPIAEGVLTLIEEVLKSLSAHGPNIVTYLMDFLIGVINAISDRLPELIKAAVNLIGAFFKGVVDALKGIDTTTLMEGIIGIGLLSALMFALSAVAGFIPGAIAGVLGMGVVIAELSLVLAALGAFAQLPGLKWLIGEGGDLLQGIGTAIGKFVGGIVGGIMGGISSQFPQIGKDLSAFMSNIQPFIEGAGKIDANSMDGVKALSQVILILTAANVLDGLTKWFTGGSSMTKFGEELAKFGPYFKAYYDSINGVDGKVVESSANAAKALAEFAKEIPNQGGVAGWFAGENSLSAFADELTKFGPKLKAYADSVQGLDANVVVNSANAAKALAEMASGLPNQGGVVGWFAGENNLSSFAEELAEFGPVLKKYADSVQGLDANVVVNSANAAKALSELADNLPNQGGLVSWFTGDNAISVFGEEIAKFGPYLKKYADSVRGMDANVVANSANGAKALSELANNLPNTGGLVSWFTGDNDIGKFGESMEQFGHSLSAYYQSIANINVSQLDGVMAGLKKIVDIANGISSVDTSGMSGFARNLADMGKNGVDGFIQAFTNAETKVSKAASGMFTAFIDGAKSKESALGKAVASMVMAAVTEIKSKRGNFETEGRTITDKFAEGIKSKAGAVKSATSFSMQGAVGGIREKYSSFYSAGSYLVDGFAKGISDSAFKAAAQAKAMAAAANKAARDELGVHSPSKVFAEIGGYVVDGFTNGISNNKGKAGKAAKGLAKVGVEAAKAVAASLKHSNSVFSDFVEKTDQNGNAVKITLEKAAEAFKSFRDSVKESIKSATGMFDAFEVETDVTGKQLLKNLKSQITGITEWASNIQILADRGVNQGLLKALSDMGPSGAKYVSALVTMSDKELKKLNKLYKQRIGLNDKAANEIAGSFVNGGKKAGKAYAKGLVKSAKATLVAVKSEGKLVATEMISGSMSAVREMKDELREIIGWTYKDAVKEMKSSLDYGKGAFQQFVNEYLTSTKNITLGNKAIKAASKAISAYGEQLYKESDYYKEDTANLKTHKKALTTLQNERKKLQKQLKKAQKSNTAASKARVKTLKQELEANKKSISAAKKQIKDDEKDIAKHTKEVFNNLRSTLSDSVSAFLDPLKVSLETGIDLFKKFESNSDLYETDKKNLEAHKKSLEELEKTQQSIQSEINRYAAQNTLAARQRVKELKKQLSEVESSIEEAKKNIEQAENDMASHSEVTVDSILENMQSQITGVTKWQQNLQTLASRGLSQGLLEKLKSMGVDGADYVDQFMKMTSDEIKKANDLFAQSENLASQTLVNNFKDNLNSAKAWADGLQKMAQMGFSQELLEKLGDMGVDGYDYVRAFLSMTPEQVSQFNKEFANSLKLPDTVADQVISSYAYAGGQSIAGFTSALAKLSKDGSDENKALVATATEIGKVIGKTLKTTSKSAGKNAVNALAKGMNEKKKNATDTSASLGNATLKSLKKVLSSKAGVRVGGNIVDGLKNGLSDGKSSVSEMARKVALSAYNAAKKTLGIKSPSRMFAELGKYTDAGFVKGLMSGEEGVYKTATSIMGRAIQEVANAIDSDMDAQPTIRPVMDLTDIQNGACRIGEMMDGYAVSGSVHLAGVTARGMSGYGVQEDNSAWDAIRKLQDTLTNLLDEPRIEQNNQFSITGNNPREIADEVSHILQQQVERRNATWA